MAHLSTRPGSASVARRTVAWEAVLLHTLLLVTTTFMALLCACPYTQHVLRASEVLIQLHLKHEAMPCWFCRVLKLQLCEMANRIEATQGVPFLKELKKRWDDHNKSTQMIRDILMVCPGKTIGDSRNTQTVQSSRGLDSNTSYCRRILNRLLTTVTSSTLTTSWSNLVIHDKNHQERAEGE